MAERTKEQILDQAVYALALVKCHYGPRWNEIGLKEIRELLSQFSLWDTDSCYRVDCYEDDTYIDFEQRIIMPPQWNLPTLEETTEQSKR